MANWHKIIDMKRWAPLRLHILKRDGYRCRNPECGKPGILEVDHIVPLMKDKTEKNKYDPSALQTLCRGCHIEKTRLENLTENQKKKPAEVKAWDRLVNELMA